MNYFRSIGSNFIFQYRDTTFAVMKLSQNLGVAFVIGLLFLDCVNSRIINWECGESERKTIAFLTKRENLTLHWNILKSLLIQIRGQLIVSIFLFKKTNEKRIQFLFKSAKNGIHTILTSKWHFWLTQLEIFTSNSLLY